LSVFATEMIVEFSAWSIWNSLLLEILLSAHFLIWTSRRFVWNMLMTSLRATTMLRMMQKKLAIQFSS
jgi:hypothetical protein